MIKTAIYLFNLHFHWSVKKLGKNLPKLYSLVHLNHLIYFIWLQLGQWYHTEIIYRRTR